MNTCDFLGTILPSSGFYCAVELTTRRKEHTYWESIEELHEQALAFSSQNKDSYFTLATFNTPQRKADNAAFIKSFFVDLDVGESTERVKKYSTKKLAVQSLNDFVVGNALPTPWIVSSGGGVHAYWPFTEDVPYVDWLPAAERFKRLCAKQGLLIDPNVTADAARVLRMPGTYNYKLKDNPRPVRILLEGDPALDFEAIADRLKTEINGYDYEAVSNIAISGVPLTNAPGSSALQLFQNIQASFKRILEKTKEGRGCSQLQYYIENASADGMEPLWRAMLSIAKHTEESDKAAKMLSKLHPYDHQRMYEKLRAIKGPYTCEKIDGINPGGCEGCPVRGKVKSPIVLGNEVKVDNTEKEITASVEENIVFTRPIPPKDFSYGEHGGMYRKVKKKDHVTGELFNADVCFVSYDIFVTGTLSRSSEVNSIHVVANQPTGLREVIIPAQAIVSKDETLKTLGKNLVYATAGNEAHLYDFIKFSASETTVRESPKKIPDTYGWQDNGSFIIAGKELSADGIVRSVPSNEDHVNLLPITTPKGTIDNWRKIVHMLMAKHRADILFPMLVSFGAPLMAFTGHYGLLINVQSHLSGTGKSLSLALASSIFGHPTDYMITPETSVVALQLRMGMLHNLPLIMDEVTYKAREGAGDQDWISKFLLDMTMGKSKERMESAATKERKNIVRWATLALMSSNASLVDALTSRNYTTDGELQRMLEIDMHTPISFTREERDVLELLVHNYGVAGHVYLKWLAENRSTVVSVMREVYELVEKRFAIQGKERFWHAGLTAMIAGGILASEKYAKVINLPMKDIVAEAIRLVLKSRGVVDNNVRTAFDVLHAFIRDNYGNFIVVRKREEGLSTSLGIRDVIDESIARSMVRGRIEHGFKPGIASIYIEKTMLTKHCHQMSYNSASFKKDLGERYKVTDDAKKHLFAHTKVKSVRVNTVCIELPENELEDMEPMNAPERPAENQVPVD